MPSIVKVHSNLPHATERAATPPRCDDVSPGSPKAITQLTIIVGIVFVAVLLALNTDLFRRPIYEWADFAANSIQIQNAKHFRELLGNYSRWGFHHPGPVFFYVFAAGELL